MPKNGNGPRVQLTIRTSEDLAHRLLVIAQHHPLFADLKITTNDAVEMAIEDWVAELESTLNDPIAKYKMSYWRSVGEAKQREKYWLEDRALVDRWKDDIYSLDPEERPGRCREIEPQIQFLHSNRLKREAIAMVEQNG
jgi:hypothetical protein